MKLISGRANPKLSKAIAEKLNMRLTDTTVTTFPNGEIFVKINENIRGKDIFFIQPTCPPTNDNLMELLIMVDAAKRASASRITAVMPFFGYARQDRKLEPRVPITAKLVADLLQSAGVHRVLTVDLHTGQIQGFFDIPVDNLFASPIILDYFKKKSDIENLVVASPDVGGIKMAHTYSKALGIDMVIIAKRRENATKVSVTNLIGDVAGKDVLIVDDMTESAGTLIAAAERLMQSGARNIYAGVTHGIFSDLAKERLVKSNIKQVICTDSTPHAEYAGNKIVCLSIARLLAKAIIRIHDGQSVSSLFEVK